MKLFRVIAKLYRFATCAHINTCVKLKWDDSTEMCTCTHCGRVLWITDEGHSRHNPHLLRDRLDPR
jgi:hypothetical protein